MMNDIPPSLVISWDQTAIHLVPVSGWTMNREGEKSIPISGLNNKREITVVLAATLAGEYLPPHLLYQGKTEGTTQKLSLHMIRIGCVAL